MTDNNLNTYEDLAIDDTSPMFGYVIATDNNGNVIFKKHNMIVDTAKEIIRNWLFLNFSSADRESAAVKISAADNPYTGFDFSRVKLGQSMAMTVPTDTDLKLPIANDKIMISAPSISNETIKINDRYSININVSVSSVRDAVAISELGLFITPTNENGLTGPETMFSRVIFDPIYIGTGSSITNFSIKYYIFI